MNQDASIALANLAAARSLVDSLVASGLRHAVVCPGSRSGPLAVAIDERGPELRSYVVTDERSAGFFALGLARESGDPALVVCTSGTAAANLVPAAAEATFGEIPMLVVTADRPPETRDFGAPQTIHQVGLFAHHSRWSLDLAPPGSDGPPSAYYAATAARAFAIAASSPRGPVHLNVPFREPLVPVPLAPRSRESARVRAEPSVAMLAPGHAERLATELRDVERGLLVCGPSPRAAETAPAIATLARKLGWPVIADPLSGLRSDDFADVAIADAHDALLRSAVFRRDAKPEAVVRFGGVPTSKALQQALAEWGGAPQILFAAPCTWPDPTWSASEVVACDAAVAAEALSAAIAGMPMRARPAWTAFWLAASATARETLDAAVALLPSTAEARVAHELPRRLPAGGLLFVGNSMPVRDVDAFCARVPRAVTVLANRGANGIDGVLSTALGAALSSGRPTMLLLGDLSFLHDAQALELAARLSAPLLVVVINNDGGGIFHALPVAGLGEVFERCFATPHGLELTSRGVSARAGVVDAVRVTGGDELDRAVADWLARPRTVLVEVPSDRRDATIARAALHSAAVSSVERIRRSAA